MASKRALKYVNLISGGASTCVRVIEEEKPGGELYGLSETVAVIASASDIEGIQNVKEAGFSEDCIHVVESGSNFDFRILEVMNQCQPDYFHQLGFMPKMPAKVLSNYRGLNQHLGPGGKWMYGVRRVYTHIRFCEEVGRKIPIQVFCQIVDPEYDAGVVVYAKSVDLDFSRTPEKNAKDLLLPIEHRVQIEGRREMFFGFNLLEAQAPAKIALNQEEERILLEMKKEARSKYPPDKM
ncbi:MAG: hypothetical protein ACD_15C00152G0006 [uncultured bacterium]|nr:MAG: hypothetical protein ACD_15C00152G0006 [uncultured bacterium]HCU70944.1 hypothetical protein [Candidatus Moranbacteria bacterium]